jgi:tetratricopeptide (TPR) repeat protein
MTEKTRAISARNAYRAPSPPAAPPAVSSPTTLFVRPLWRLAGSGFREVWNALIYNRPAPGRRALPGKRVLDDSSVVFATRGIPRSINKARNILAFLRRRLGGGRMPLVPVQLMIDAGAYVSLDGTVSRESEIDWPEIEPGEIFLSHAAYCHRREHESWAFDPHPSGKFYRLVDTRQRPPAGSVSFRFGAPMFRGSGRPCFYCGLRRHPSKDCPTKTFDGAGQAMESLGHLSSSRLNRLFFGYLMGQRGEVSGWHPPGGSVRYEAAAEGILALGYIHQLRFFARLWGMEDASWDRTVNGRAARSRRKGGMAWLAFDCLRSSNHPQAEAILEKALENAPYDFRLHCIAGYLNIEQGHPDRAGGNFNRALGYAETNPQRIFLHFLLFRLACIEERLIDAEKRLDEILSLDPRCLDAIFHSIVFSLRRKEESRAKERLVQLVRSDRRYFVRALIAPELAPFQPVVGQPLDRLFAEARAAADAGMAPAEAAVERLKNLLGEEDRSVGEMRSLWRKTREAHDSKSYFGYLDAGRSAAAIVSGVQREIGKRQDYCFRILAGLEDRSLELLDGVRSLSDPGRAGRLHAELKGIRGAIDAVRKDVRLETSGVFAGAPAACRGIAEGLGRVRARLELLKSLQAARDFIVTFSRISLIFQPINLVIGLVLLPLVVRHLLSGGEDLSAHLSLYQFVAVFVGGASGVVYALVKSLEQAGIE